MPTNKNNNNKNAKGPKNNNPRPKNRKRVPQGGPKAPARLYAKPRETYGALGRMAQTIAIPRDHRPLRLPTFPNLERTAVLAFTDTTTEGPVPNPTSGSTNTTMDYVLTRDPALPLWGQFTVGGKRWFCNEYPTHLALPARGNASILIPPIPRWYGTDALASDSPDFRHLQNGRDFYVFLGGGSHNEGACKFQIQVHTATSADNNTTMYFHYTLERVTSRGEISTFGTSSMIPAKAELVTLLDSAVTLPEDQALEPGSYYSFKVTVTLPDDTIGARILDLTLTGPDPTLDPDTGCTIRRVAAGFYVTSTNQSLNVTDYQEDSNLGKVIRLWPRSPPAEMSNTQIFESVRATATAVLFTNVGQAMFKEGTAAAARVACKDFPVFDAGSWGGFQSVNPHERYFGALEKGVYAYTLPDSHSEEFLDCAITTEHGVRAPNTEYFAHSVLTKPVIHLHRLAYATCIRLTDPSPTSATSLAMTLDRHVEFRTSSRLFPTSYSTFQLEAYHTAQMALARMGTITENPTHMATIAIAVARALRAVAPVIKPYVIAAAQSVAQTGINYAQGKLDNWRQKSLR